MQDGGAIATVLLLLLVVAGALPVEPSSLHDAARFLPEKRRLQPAKVFNVLNFGAVGDGRTDDTQAFLKAWAAACYAPNVPAGVIPALVAPPSKTFLVRPVTFEGPCRSDRVDFQVWQQIVAPGWLGAWQGRDPSSWILFFRVKGLSVWGAGTINGSGSAWWQKSCKRNPRQGCTREAPTAMKFVGCDSLVVMNLKFVDSQQIHVAVIESAWVRISGVRITAPGNSPNTDGIHIERAHHVTIHNAIIATGDDCISIGNGTFDVNITDISCGPGHGISIGSLGKFGGSVSVENIRVRHVNFYGTQNGARIKTCQGGSGYARGISFMHMQFTNVENPIIIDQFYRDLTFTDQYQNLGVKVSDVSYANAVGTSSTPTAVILNCIPALGCSSLVFDNVNITASDPRQGDTKSLCQNAGGYARGYVHPHIPCLH